MPPAAQIRRQANPFEVFRAIPLLEGVDLAFQVHWVVADAQTVADELTARAKELKQKGYSVTVSGLGDLSIKLTNMEQEEIDAVNNGSVLSSAFTGENE